MNSEKVFVVRVEHSQTDWEFIAVHGKHYYDAEAKVKQKYPNAYYYSCACKIDTFLEQ